MSNMPLVKLITNLRGNVMINEAEIKRKKFRNTNFVLIFWDIEIELYVFLAWISRSNENVLRSVEGKSSFSRIQNY